MEKSTDQWLWDSKYSDLYKALAFREAARLMASKKKKKKYNNINLRHLVTSKLDIQNVSIFMFSQLILW